MTHTVYPHDQVYGEYCTVQAHIDCPPAKVFAYMAEPVQPARVDLQRPRACGRPGRDDLLVGVDARRHANLLPHRRATARRCTVDYHCAWDQGDELWMIYLNRIVPAERVLGDPARS